MGGRYPRTYAFDGQQARRRFENTVCLFGTVQQLQVSPKDTLCRESQRTRGGGRAHAAGEARDVGEDERDADEGMRGMRGTGRGGGRAGCGGRRGGRGGCAGRGVGCGEDE